MSKKNPECPVVIPRNCSDFRNARVCALIRSDKRCFHKPGGSRTRIQVDSIGPPHQPNQPRPIRNIQTTIKKGSSGDFVYRRR
jgi:hypothetical protein